MNASDPKVVGHVQPRRSRASFDGWPLRWKVAATLVVPIVLAATFGALRIQNELSTASKLSVASGNTRVVAPSLEFLDRLDGLAAAAASGAPIEEPLAQFDAGVEALDSLITSADLDSTVTAELASASTTARTLRDEIAGGAVPNTQIAEQSANVATDVVAAVTTSTATVDDDVVRPLAEQLTAVLTAQRALTTQQVLVTAPDFGTSVALRTSAADAAGAESAAIERLTQLSPDGDRAGQRQHVDVRRDAYAAPLGEPVQSNRFTSAIQTSSAEYRSLAQQLATDLDDTVQARATAARSAALRDTAIILGAVLAALVFALGVGRSLIRSIGRLRRGAADVAQIHLPAEIEQLSRGSGVPEIRALPIHTDEEVGQLARAIDDIHLQAVRLAGEHGVRLQIGDMFETLSRRSRSLVEEQLVLIETLELDEDDPNRLDHLFRLDHLATRMRRNGDNLLVLADTVERHRRLEPVPVPEVLRAAMSEVEDYRRVQLGSVVDGSIVGAAAGDVGHLIAELLDNALQYSPPDSPVWVSVSRAVDAGILVEIADRGLGMPAEDLAEANERLALGGEVTSDTAKRMGLFVVGRLARRHNATVRLRSTPGAMDDQPGVTASVHLPGVLLAPPTAITDAPGGEDFSDTGPIPVPIPSRRHQSVDAARTSSPAPHNRPARDSSLALPRRAPGASGIAAGAGRPAPPPPPPEVEPAWPQAESDDGSIYARMTTEWMRPSPRESHDARRSGATPADWAAAARAADHEPQRHTRSGLPIRERGARLVPAHTAENTDAEVTKNPAAVRDVLSRQLAGVRRGRAETEAAHRRDEGGR